ncbi:MAG: VCBS repeat-containing protein, partial [Candidatus Thorarchaeota archaeon]
LIAAANLQVYVFEDTGIDDTYKLAFSLDLRESGFNATLGWTRVTKITALGAGDDYDLNGERELVVAAGPYLFVYNIGRNKWTSENEYFMGSNELTGRYYLVGNGANSAFYEASIDALALCDTDEDGFREIILGGRLNTTQMRQDGFLKIYEWRGSGFVQAWEAPTEVTYWNPVTRILIDDQDYDSKQEIIIGHREGFDIWESTGLDSEYVKVEVVTSSPNYPRVNVTSVYRPGESGLLTSRGDNDISYVFTTSSDWIVSVFCQGNRIWQKYYYRPLNIWGLASQPFPDYDYGYPGATVQEYRPSLFLHQNGSLYLIWKTYIVYGSNSYYDMWVSRYVGPGWLQPKHVLTDSSNIRDYPAMFSLSTSLGMIYTRTSDGVVYRRLLSSWSGPWSSGVVVPYKDYTRYFVQSADIAMLPDGGYALAISARNNSLSKTDLDIFVATSNSSFYWAKSPMLRATTSYNNEVNPDLSVLDDPERTLVVVYESIESPIEDRIQMSYSNTYTSWKQHEPLTSFPMYYRRVELPGGGVQYWYNDTTRIYSPLALSPSVVGLRGGGFMQMHVFDFWTKSRTNVNPGEITKAGSPYHALKYVENADLLYGINPSSRFTHFNIESVVDMAVGDTDGDGRREVVVGFENRVGVYELKHSNVGDEVMEHEEAWLSNAFPQPVTGVTVYDSNGNGYEEIAASCQRGEVYVFETVHSSVPAVSLLRSRVNWSSYLGPGVEGFMGRQVLSYDIDRDGKAEAFVGLKDGKILAYYGNGTALWSAQPTSGSIWWMDIGIVAADLCIASLHLPPVAGQNISISLIDAFTGNVRWSFKIPTYTAFSLGHIGIADVTDSPGGEVVVTTTLNRLYVYHFDGTRLYGVKLGANPDIMPIAFGNFTGDQYSDIAIVHSNASLSLLDGRDGSVILHMEESFGSPLTPPTVGDLNRDSHDDVFIGRTHLWVIDSLNKSILYNSTIFPDSPIRRILVDDYDGDGVVDAIVTTGREVYLERVSSGRMMWSYRYTYGTIYDASPVTLDHGRKGVAICTSDGLITVLDALSGVVVWFYLSSKTSNGIVSGDFDGNGVSEVGVTDSVEHKLAIYERVVPNASATPPGYNIWRPVWNLALGTTDNPLLGIWSADIDWDGYAEFVVAQGGQLLLYDPLGPALVWTSTIGGDGARDIQFADLNNDGILDMLVLYRKSGWYVVSGINGLNGYTLPGRYHAAPTGVLINAFVVGELRAAVTGSEYAIVYTDPVNTTYIDIHDRTGNLIYKSSLNATNFFPEWAGAADLDGDGSQEILVTGAYMITQSGMIVWRGDGTPFGSAGPFPYPIASLATGNIDGDSRIDIVIGLTVGSLVAFEPYSGAF